MTIQYKELIDPGTYEASVILGRRSHFLCHLWRTTFQPHNFWNYSLGGSSPISKRITLIYKPFRPFGRRTTLLRGLINHGYQPLTSPGMILQARCSNLQRLWSFGRNKILAKLGSYYQLPFNHGTWKTRQCVHWKNPLWHSGLVVRDLFLSLASVVKKNTLVTERSTTCSFETQNTSK